MTKQVPKRSLEDILNDFAFNEALSETTLGSQLKRAEITPEEYNKKISESHQSNINKALTAIDQIVSEVIGFDEGVSSNLIPDPSWEYRNELRATQRQTYLTIKGEK